MRFDADVAREILLELEKTPANRAPGDVEIEGVTEDEIFEYLELLSDERLLEARFIRAATGQGRIYAASVIRLTKPGHDFLAAARNETMWEKAKDKVTSSGAAMTLAVLKALLVKMSMKAVGLDDPGMLE